MAESGVGLSKAAKKNLKRREKKSDHSRGDADTATENEFTPEKLLPLLKEELEKAKAEKDHQRAGKLRDQIWVLTDLIKGYKTNIPEEDLLPILQNLPMYSSEHKASSTAKDPPPKTSSTVTSVIVTPEERKIKNLQTKLQQIEKLKEKQAKGEKLEANQVAKIQNEGKIKEEIEELEEIIRSVANFSTGS